jgi:hypothetical protein
MAAIIANSLQSHVPCQFKPGDPPHLFVSGRHSTASNIGKLGRFCVKRHLWAV